MWPPSRLLNPSDPGVVPGAVVETAGRVVAPVIPSLVILAVVVVAVWEAYREWGSR